MSANPVCPTCGGGWLENFRFAHSNDCQLRVALDATHAADVADMTPPSGRYLRTDRASTPAELHLLTTAFGQKPSANPMTRTSAITRGVVRRTVDGYDPDIDTEQETPHA